MVFVKTFVSELSKKIEMLHAQIELFEKKVSQVNLLVEIIEKSTLKEISEINGDDLALLSEHNFKKITEIVNFNDNEEVINKFISNAVSIKLYTKFLLEGTVDDELEKRAENSKIWLDQQANYIKEFVVEFKLSNENYLNSLKQSDYLYEKYISYFNDDELVEPITNLNEFNDVLKKCGLIMSEKWQLLKYIAQKNIVLEKKFKQNNLLDEVDLLLKKEGYILDDLTEEQYDFCISLIDMEDSKIKRLNLSNEELIKYQKIPILHNIKSLYNEISDMIKKSCDLKKIEQKKRELKSFKDSYDFFKKIK